MKKLIALLIILLSGIPDTIAGDWQKTFVKDEFGVPDRSKPIYIVILESPENYRGLVSVAFANGTFILQFVDEDKKLYNVHSMKVKTTRGNVSEIKFHEAEKGILTIDSDYEPMFVDLLDNGNFYVSIKNRDTHTGKLTNHSFHIRRQTTGIRDILEADGWYYPAMHSDF
ncbi:MAG: hypothetical protein K2M94_04580 [Paramuribaculum sp.]|nr:hypothetical protein [Paramuribaculum sp.]